MELTVEQVDAINQVLIEEEYITSKSLSEPERYDLAIYWIGEAEKAWIENPSFAKNDEAIRTILNVSPNGYPDKTSTTGSFKSGLMNIEGSLPIPRDADFEYKSIPPDYTELTDLEIRKYSSHNQHFLNRARYLLANTINHLASANHLRDDSYRKAYQRYNKEILKMGERPTKDLIDSFAKEDEEYMMYDKDAREAQEKVTIYKALVEVYSGNVERLSREMTFRKEDYERGR